MFRFREFRTHCRNADTAEIIAALEKCLDFEDCNSYFKACNYLSELINKKSFKLNVDLLNFLYEFKGFQDKQLNLSESENRIGIIIKTPESFPIELLSAINRIHFIPVVILLGQNPDNTDYSETLAQRDIASTIIDIDEDIAVHISNLTEIISSEKLSKLILHANPADLDFLILSRLNSEDIITYHQQIPLLSSFTYCEQEDSLNKGCWERNIGLPLFERFTAIYIEDGQKLPVKSFNYLTDCKLLLLNSNPLECLSEIPEELIKNVVFIQNPVDYAEGLKSTKVLLLTEENFEFSLQLAFKYGLAVKYLESGVTLSYEEVRKKFDLRNKFSTVLSTVYKTKVSYRKKFPRIILFRNDAYAPVIGAINKNISAALKHAGCPVLDIDINPMVVASAEKDWNRLKNIQLQTMDLIDHFSPDAALGYNDDGIFPNGESHILEKKGIPYYGLFFDNPFFFSKSLDSCKDKSLTRILTLDKYFIEPLKQNGFSETYYFPIATSMHHHAYRNKHSFDPERFIFTSTVKQVRSAESVALEVENKNDQDFIKYAFDEILNNNCYSLDSLLGNYSHYYSKDYKRFQNEVWFRIENQCSSLLRLQTVESLVDFPLDIYGGGNWKEINLSEKHQYKGRLNYDRLHEACRQSLGTICRTPLTIQNGIQQRILDCGAAKGFILSDYRPVLEEH
ncbi:MAG: DUF3880 domain-containing protein, partial [Lentisphaeraceae bacterium]|nr:DUF3880 domain-containing protein [Lentisphaeraceae bacterium]